MKLKNILVPIDFSKCSNNALLHAIELAERSDARLTLLHCYTIQIPAAEVTIDIQPELTMQYRKIAERNFEHLKNTTPALKKVVHQEIIEVSFVRDGILETAGKIEADLIVMGTNGADNRMDAFFGTNTYHTIKKSKIPVLAIPAEASFKPFQKILFAADFKRVEDVDRLGMIKTLARLFKAEVQILHVGKGWGELNTHQTSEAAAIIEYFDLTKHSYHFTREDIEVEVAIEEHLKEYHNELLVLIARKHSFSETLFSKKVTRPSVLHTSVPLLTLPEQ